MVQRKKSNPASLAKFKSPLPPEPKASNKIVEKINLKDSMSSLEITLEYQYDQPNPYKSS